MTGIRVTTHLYPVHDLAIRTDANIAVERITVIYERSTQTTRDRFYAFARGEDCSEDFAARYLYPGTTAGPKTLVSDARPAWGTVAYPGVYGTTLAWPSLFRNYYRAQIKRLLHYYNSPVVVGVSNRPVPPPFVAEASTVDITPEQARVLGGAFTLPDLAQIDDSIADGTYRLVGNEPQSLPMFTAERVDLALQRLYHYTAMHPRHLQRFMLFTNYQHHVDEFAASGRKLMEDGNDEGCIRFVEPGDTEHDLGMPAPDGSHCIKGLPQMPAYHLAREGCPGVALVNIGVGLPNAKTITDHLAVLRPHCWMMIGHCGGLRRSQQLGDYALIHTYVHDDHVLDRDPSPWVPVLLIAKTQVALQETVARITGLSGTDTKLRMRTGIVVSTDDRSWEPKYQALYSHLNQSRAITIDMESATIIANDFRLRVPYGTLPCVSDKPLHDGLKLCGMANLFYHQRVSQYSDIGMETMRLLRESGVEVFHSCKLRSSDEPAFR